MFTKESLLAAAKAGARAFGVAFLGALGFGAVAPGLIDSILTALGLN